MKKWLAILTLAVLLIWCIIFSVPYNRLGQNESFLPQNDQQHTCGDHRIYFSGVNEVRHDFWNFHLAGGMKGPETRIDESKFMLYRLAYLTGLFTEDPRTSYVVSSVVATLLTTTLLFFLFCGQNLSPFISACLSIIFLFYLNIFRSLLNLDFSSAMSVFNSTILNSKSTLFLENINDNFRYLVLLHENIFIIGSLFLALRLSKDRSLSKIEFLLWTLFTLALFYTYASVIFYALAFIGLTSLVSRSKPAIRNTSYLAGLVGVVGLVLGIPTDIWQIYSSVPSTISQGVVSHSVAATNSPHIVGAFILFILLSLFAYKKKLPSRHLVFAGSIILLLQIPLLLLGYTALAERFFFRGLQSILFILVLLTLPQILAPLRHLKFLKAISQVVIVILCITPSVGIFRMAIQYAEAKSFTTLSETYKAYDWLRNNVTTESSILALNFRDIQILPALMPINLELAGAEFLRNPDTEYRKYAYFTKKLELKNEIAENIDDYWKKRQLRTCEPKLQTNNDSTYMFDQIFYYPYSKMVNNINIANETGLTSEFIKYIDSVAATPSIDPKLPEFVILTEGQFSAASNLEQLGFVLVFSSDTRKIYKNKIP